MNDLFKNKDLSSPNVLRQLAQDVCAHPNLNLKLERGGRGIKGDAVLHYDPATGQWVQSFGVFQTRDSLMYRTLAHMTGKDWDISLNTTLEPFISVCLIEQYGSSAYL